MTKIVYNACYGGFSVSAAGMRRYAEIKGIPLWVEKGGAGFWSYYVVPPEKRTPSVEPEAWYRLSMDERQALNAAQTKEELSIRDFDRTDPVLVQVVEELGDAASGGFANLKIAEVPTGSKYKIDEYDGYESVNTPDSYEWQIAP